MHTLKTIRPESIPRAIAKAERYRLLNEPREAESICRDILAITPDHDEATRILLLALTDQFPDMQIRADEPRQLITKLGDEYSRQYYTGVLMERWAKALLGAGYEGQSVYECFVEAMSAYERAIPLADADNEDAVLRWNTCARIIESRGLVPKESDAGGDFTIETFDDEVPYR